MTARSGYFAVAAALAAAAALVVSIPLGLRAGGRDCSEAEPIAVGREVTGNLRGADLIYYAFEAPDDLPFNIYTTGDSDTVGLLLDADCRVLAADDDSGEGLNFRIERELGSATYYVAVRGKAPGDSASFTLLIEVAVAYFIDDRECARGATPVRAGQAVAGETRGTDPIRYSFLVESAGVYRVYTTGGTNTVGRLTDWACRLLAEDDDSGGGANFLIERELEPGMHFLELRGYYTDRSGPFTLRIEKR